MWKYIWAIRDGLTIWGGALFLCGFCVIFLIVFHLHVAEFCVSWFFWCEGREWKRISPTCETWGSRDYALGAPGMFKLHCCRCARLRCVVTFLRGVSISGGVCELDG